MKKIQTKLTKLVIDDISLLSRDTLCNLHKSQFHPRTNLFKFDSPLIPLPIIPAHIIACKTDHISVLNCTLCRRRALVPSIRSRHPPTSQHEICDIPLVAQIQDGFRRRSCTVENFTNTTRYAVCFNADKIVSEVDRPSLFVVGYKHDAACRGKADGVWGKRRKEGLEGFHN